MIQRGVPLYEVQRILGHSTPLLTQRYAHLAPDFDKRGAAAIDAVLTGPNSASTESPRSSSSRSRSG